MSRPDYLRLEHFGGLYFSRATHSYHALEPFFVRFLLAARERSAIELCAADDSWLPFPPPVLAENIVRWQQEGFLDDTYRCRARVVSAASAPCTLVAPLKTSLYVTDACNLRCRHCYVPTAARPTRSGLGLDVAAALFAELEALGALQLVISGGEPLVRPDLLELLALANGHGLEVTLCTNATTITPKVAARLARVRPQLISVSVDGATAATHDALRGTGAFAKTVRGIRALLGAASVDVRIRTTVTTLNVDDIEALVPFAAALGVRRLAIKPFRALGVAGAARALVLPRPVYEGAAARVLSRAADFDCQVSVATGMPERFPAWTGVSPAFACTGGTTRATVLADGRVVACGAVPAADDWTLADHSYFDCWQHAPSITRWRQIPVAADCRACAVLASCAGGCRARAVAAFGTLAAADPWGPCPPSLAPTTPPRRRRAPSRTDARRPAGSARR
ncbi:MAG: radical SAM protein [Deltaproteobacteria bacterium]|nr:radical SAM protein [Deltaproteobacteria bacterium]